jgi:hypothetical protein
MHIRFIITILLCSFSCTAVIFSAQPIIGEGNSDWQKDIAIVRELTIPAVLDKEPVKLGNKNVAQVLQEVKGKQGSSYIVSNLIAFADKYPTDCTSIMDGIVQDLSQKKELLGKELQSIKRRSNYIAVNLIAGVLCGSVVLGYSEAHDFTSFVHIALFGAPLAIAVMLSKTIYALENKKTMLSHRLQLTDHMTTLIQKANDKQAACGQPLLIKKQALQ